MATILFLAPADLGETVLATGALAHVMRGEDEITVVCDPEAAPLLRALPGLIRTHVIQPGAPFRSWVDLLLAPSFREELSDVDHCINGRGGFAGAILSGVRRETKNSLGLRHQVDEWTDAYQADRPLNPKIWLDDRARQAAAAVAPGAAPVLLIAPGGVSAAKRWPHERFAAVARRLATGALNGARIVVLSAATRDDDIAARIVSSLDADGVPASGAGLDLLAAAALAERATLCIGNDNALTHIAAAMGAPTLTLFGPTDERVRAPRGPRVRTLRGKSFEEAALDEGAAMDDISIDAVEAAALDLLHAGGLR